MIIILLNIIISCTLASQPLLPPNNGTYYFTSFKPSTYEPLSFYIELQVGNLKTAKPKEKTAKTRNECQNAHFCP